jgi:hypothetical protein
MKTQEPIDRTRLPGTEDAAAFDCSHAVRLSGRQWLIAATFVLAIVALTPVIGDRVETFHPGGDYRMPYELSHDYWLFRRYCRQACQQEKILVVGDSVVWGHYVQADQTLAHYLNELSSGDRFVNLGLDGTHPAALDGLLRHYGRSISSRTVILHFNPLWLSSDKHDLQTTKEFHFNHPELVPQFTPSIPCYKAPPATRIRIALGREIPFRGWASHMRIAYFQNLDLLAWTLEHPYESPLSALKRRLPGPEAPQEAVRAAASQKEAAKQDVPWVELESSLQWRLFRRTVGLLRERDNRVFVLAGPFNEHLLTERSAAAYGRIKDGIAMWMRENDVPCLIPPPLPASSYVDASHPLAEGYARLAETLLNDPSFASVTQIRSSVTPARRQPHPDYD